MGAVKMRCVVSVHLPFHQSSHWRTQEKVKGSGIPIGWDGRGFGWLVWGQLWPFHLYSRRITITSLHDYGQTGQFWKPKPGKTHVCNFREVLITAKPLAKSYKRRKRGTFIGINMLSNHVVGIDSFYCIWDSFIVYGTLLLYVANKSSPERGGN